MGELILRYGSQFGIGIAELGPNCRNEIAIGFVEIGLTLKRGKGPRPPHPRSRLRSPRGMHRTQFEKIEAISEFQAISERSSAPLSATERKRKLGLDRKPNEQQLRSALDGARRHVTRPQEWGHSASLVE